MRPLRFRNGDDTFSPHQIEEMQERLAALERLSTNQQHQLVEQQTEMLRLRAILLAVGRELPDIDGLPTVPLMPAVRPQSRPAPAPSASVTAEPAGADALSSPPELQPETASRPQTHLPTSRRALLKWGSAAAAAGVAAAAANVLQQEPTAKAAGTAWTTGTVSVDADTIVQPGSGYAGNNVLQLQQGSATPFQPAALKTALAAYDTTGNNTGVYGTSSGGTGLYGVTDTGTAAQGDAGLYAKALSTGTGVAGSSGSGIGVQGNSNTGIGGSFTGGQAPLALGLGTAAGAPTTGTHIAGEIYADVNATLFICVQGGAPGIWNKIAWAGSLRGGQVNLLPAPIRVLDTRPTLWAANTSHDVQVTGVVVNGISVPTGALAMIGNVTVTQTTGSGFLTLFPQGAPLPNTSTINYVGGQTVANATTVGLSSSGRITIYAANQGAYVILDVAGYIM